MKKVYIVTQDLYGLTHRMAFDSFEEAELRQEYWWIEWGRRASKPTIYEQVVWHSFAEYEKYKMSIHQRVRKENEDPTTAIVKP